MIDWLSFSYGVMCGVLVLWFFALYAIWKTYMQKPTIPIEDIGKKE